MIPRFLDLMQVVSDEENCIQFLYNNEILLHKPNCICGGPFTRRAKKHHCNRYACKKSLSIFSGTFFARNRIKCNEVMHLAYLWLTNCSSETIIQHTGHTAETVSAYKRHFRQLVGDTLETDDMIIGGEGIVVQIDETKFGKRKYHRGHRVDGAWAIVGVELTAERNVFTEVVEDRSEQTIINVLQRHVASRSIIWTDCWKGYRNISRIFDVDHQTVNHSREFKSESGVNTNTVEGTNYALKRFIPPRNRTRSLLGAHLMEFIWRRKNIDSLWEGLLQALKNIEYTQ